MKIAEFDSATSCLTVHGEFTIYQAAQAKEAIFKATGGFRILEIDMANVTEFDTAGLQLLLCLKLASDNALRVTNPSPSVVSVLTLLHMDPGLAPVHIEGSV